MPAPTQTTLIKLLQESDGALMEVQAMDSIVSDLFEGKSDVCSNTLNDIDSLCDKAIAHLKAVKRITKSI